MTTAELPPSPPTVARSIDLSFPVRDHFRWPIETDLIHDLSAGDVFQTTRIRTICHAFTHADAPLHVDAGGTDIASMDLATWVGEAAVVDLSDVEEDAAITEDLLAARGDHVRGGDIALIRTDWDARQDVAQRSFWERSPYLTRGAANWLAERRIVCAGFDFPQDHAIRGVAVGGPPARAEEFVTHDVLLRRGVGLLEYLAGLRGIRGPRTFLVALPLRLAGVDGSPVRAVALEFEASTAPPE